MSERILDAVAKIRVTDDRVRIHSPIRVGRFGEIRLGDLRYWSPKTGAMAGREVMLRSRPDDIMYIQVWSQCGLHFLTSADLIDDGESDRKWEAREASIIGGEADTLVNHSEDRADHAIVGRVPVEPVVCHCGLCVRILKKALQLCADARAQVWRFLFQRCEHCEQQKAKLADVSIGSAKLDCVDVEPLLQGDLQAASPSVDAQDNPWASDAEAIPDRMHAHRLSEGSK